MSRKNMKWVGYVMLVFVFGIAINLDVQAQKEKEVLKGKTVNINTATEADLVKNVPLITPELAKKIVQYRKENGDFQVIEELLQIDGFNRTLLRKIKPFLLLEGIGGKECTC